MVSISQVYRVDSVGPEPSAQVCVPSRLYERAVGSHRRRASARAGQASRVKDIALAGLKDTSNAKPVRAQLPVCCAVRAR